MSNTIFNYLSENWLGLIALFIAILTLIYTIKSAKSAKRSELSSATSSDAAQRAADATFQQVELMQQEINNSHFPKLIPLKNQTTIPLLTIDDLLKSMPLHLTKGAPFNYTPIIKITNAGIGNAYNVSAWLEISNDALKNLKNLDTPSFYKSHFGEEYKFSFTEEQGESQAMINFSSSNDGINFPTNNLFKENSSKTVLIQNEIYEMTPHPAMLLIFIDLMYREIYDHWIYSDPSVNGLELVVKFQTNKQIDTNKFTVKRYNIRINEVLYSDSRSIMTLSFDFQYLRDS